MGVPSYFRNIVKTYPEIVFPANPSEQQIDNFFIDANSMIHPAVATVLQTLKGKPQPTQEDLDSMFFTSFTQYLKNVIDIVNPANLTYVAIDGSAPRAKMNQQRERRYKSGKLRTISDDIYSDLGMNNFVSKFDTNAITPGTDFMKKLNDFLHKYFGSKSSGIKCKIVLSSSSVPGEGEHKIMSLLRRSCNDPDHVSINCIYGLDADLIFLAMSSNIPNILLFRERVFFGSSKEKPEADTESAFDYLSIDLLRRGIVDDCNFRTRSEFDEEKIIRDYIFICFFLGNDFLPHLPSLSIHAGGLEHVLRAYLSILRTSEKHLVLSDGTVNTTFFKKFIAFLASEEDKTLTDDYHRRKHLGRFRQDFVDDPDKSKLENEHDRRLSENEKKIVFNGENDGVQYGSKGWKWRYWIRYFGCSPSDRAEEYDCIRRSVVQEFFKGIKWTRFYYYNDLTDWHWYYSYTMAPTLSDILEFYHDINLIKVEKNKPFRPLEQLMLVLPPSSRHLLPKSYANLMISVTSPVLHCYPIDFQVNAARKIHFSECPARLPLIDVEPLKDSLKGLRLTASEKDRNSLEKADITFQSTS